MTWWLVLILSIAAYAATGNNKSTSCFECLDLPLPLLCGHVTECPTGMKCVVEEVITTTGLALYNTGCLLETRCGLGAGRRDTRNRPLSKRTDKIICDECCEGDFCNYQGLGVTAMQQPQRGPYCFQCDYLETPNQCRNVAQCNKGMDCHTIGTIVVGKKRDSTCHSCCTGDFCNRNCPSHSLTSVTSSIAVPTSPTAHVTSAISVPTSPLTPATSQTTTSLLKDICHKHHYSYDANSNLCYAFHDHNRTWVDANQHCQNEGGLLAVIDTQAKWDFLKPHIKLHYHHDDIYIGGRDHGNADYRWTNGQKLTFNAWSGGEPDGGHGYCMYINHHDDYKWHDGTCGHHRPYICTIQIGHH